MSAEHRLAGGNTGGAVRIGDTVRRTPGAWTPSVHAVLQHLEAVGFDRAPRALGFDDQGREVLSFLPGNVVGDTRPWPKWVHSDKALQQVARWLREFHGAIASFTPPNSATASKSGSDAVSRTPVSYSAANRAASSPTDGAGTVAPMSSSAIPKPSVQQRHRQGGNETGHGHQMFP